MKNYLKNIIIALGIILTVTNCQNDELISSSEIQSEYKVSKISFEDIQQNKNLNSVFKEIENSLDFKKGNTNSNKNIISSDNSFTILTDEIYRVVKDSTETYSFRIKTPTLSTSSFENFIVKKTSDDNFIFQIYRYQRLLSANNIEFPYTFSTQVVDSNQINIGDFNNLLSNKLYYDASSGCIYEFGMNEFLRIEMVLWYYCPGASGSDGGGGGSSTGDGGSSGQENTGDEDYGNSVGSEEGGGAIGNSNNSSSNNSTPVVIIQSPEAKMLDDFFENLTDGQNDCLNSQSNLDLHSEIKTFLKANFDENNTALDENFIDAQNFAKLVLDNCGSDVDWDKKIFFDTTWEDYPCQKNIIKDTYNGYGEIGQTVNLIFTDEEIFKNKNIYLNYDIESLPLLPNGDRILGLTNTPLTSSGDLLEINITLDQSLIDASTDLGIFAVNLHENFHALLSYFLEVELINTYDENTNLSSLAQEYAKRKTATITDPSTAKNLQHEIISEMINTLALEIKNYGLSKNYVIDDIIYEALAWIGLENTETFIAKDTLEKNLIYDTIDNEITNFKPFSYGTPCN